MDNNVPPRHIVIVGATSAIAEHCARIWATAAPCRFTLIGRESGRVERVAADLRVRNPAGTAWPVIMDLVDPAAIQQTVERVSAQSPIDIALIAHGSMPAQSVCQNDLSVCAQVLAINGTSPVLWAEAFARQFAARGQGTLALIGSVAGDRGRKSNYAYGAGKGLVARYAEGLQHRFAGTAIRVVLIKPGPTDTPMTAHLKANGARLAAVDAVAANIVRAIERGQRVVYVPGLWRLIMLVIRHLPAAVFNRLNI